MKYSEAEGSAGDHRAGERTETRARDDLRAKNPWKRGRRGRGRGRGYKRIGQLNVSMRVYIKSSVNLYHFLFT